MGLDMYLESSKHGDIMYWRKANQIHGFFSSLAKNGGLDNCQKIRVPLCAFRDLQNRCEQILQSLAISSKKKIIVPGGFIFAEYVKSVAEYEAENPGEHLTPVYVPQKKEGSKMLFPPKYIDDKTVLIGERIYTVGEVWRYDIGYDLSVFEDDSIAKELLPPTPGFLFGNYEIDDWYVEDLKKTAEMCKSILSDPKYKSDRFYYHAWW